MSTGLTTRGRCLLAAAVAAGVCAAVLNERDLLRVAVFVLALPLLAALVARRSRHGLRAHRSLHPPRVPAGEHAQVRLRISSAGRFPAAGVLVEDAVPYAAGAKPRFVLDRLGHGSKVELHYSLNPVLRGIYPVGPATLQVSDPFGLAGFLRRVGEPTQLLVVPSTAELSGLPPGPGVAGQDGSVRMRSGQGEPDAVVRPYRHGDDLRKVHWRSTARRDELMVRTEERPYGSGTTVLLDHRGAAHRGHGTAASIEWAIAFAASVCRHLHAHGRPVRLVTEDGRELVEQPSGHNPSEATLDALAALHSTHRRELAVPAGIAGEHELIAVLGALSNAAATRLISSAGGRARGLAVLLDVAAFSPGEGGEHVDVQHGVDMLTASGWGAVVARPGDGHADTWTRLCAAATALRGDAESRR